MSDDSSFTQTPSPPDIAAVVPCDEEWHHVAVPDSGHQLVTANTTAAAPCFAPILNPGERAPAATDLQGIRTLLERVQQSPAKYVRSAYLPLPDSLDEPVVYAVSFDAPKPLWERGVDGKNKSRSGPQLNLKLHGCQKRLKRVNVGELDDGRDVSVAFFTTACQACEAGQLLLKDSQIIWEKNGTPVQSRVQGIRDDVVILDHPSWMHRADNEIMCSCSKCDGNATGEFSGSEVSPIEVWNEGKEFVLVHQSKAFKPRSQAKLCRKRTRPPIEAGSPESADYDDDQLARTRAEALLHNMRVLLGEFRTVIAQLPPSDRDAQLDGLHGVAEGALQMRGSSSPAVTLTRQLDEVLQTLDMLGADSEDCEIDIKQFVADSVLPLLQLIDPAADVLQSGSPPIEVLQSAFQMIDDGLCKRLLDADIAVLAVLNCSTGGFYTCASCGCNSGRIFEELEPDWKCPDCGTSKPIQQPSQTVAAKMPALDLEREQEVLRKCVRDGLIGRSCRVDVMLNPTVDDLHGRLLNRRYPYDYIHMSGHGDCDGLYFLKEQNKVPIDALVAMFTEHSRLHARLQAVVFNSCGGVTEGTFDRLLASGAAVVAAPGQISDIFCIQYTNGFYKAVSVGEPNNVANAHKAGLVSFQATTQMRERDDHGRVPCLFPALTDREAWQWKMESRKKERQQNAIHDIKQLRCKQEPRSYQTELADKAEQENTIVFIPTGAGKTMVASMLAERFFHRTNKLVLFVVQTIPLVFQQGSAIEADSGLRVGKFCGEVGTQLWAEELNPDNNNCVVITSGLLLNLLREGHCSLDSVSLLIFDEVHHATKKHAFNQILKDFFWTLEESQKKPHVIGLTASPGGEPSFEHTQQRVYTLCLNLKATIISPLEHRDELGQYVHRPEMKLIKVEHGVDEGILLDFLDGFIAVLRTVLLDLGFENYSVRSPCDEHWRKVLLQTVSPSKTPIEFEESLHKALAAAKISANRGYLFILEQIHECIQAYVSLCEQGPQAGVQAIEHTIRHLNCGWAASLVGTTSGNSTPSSKEPTTPAGVSERLNQAIRDSPIYTTIEENKLTELAEQTMSPKTKALLVCLREYANSEEADMQDRIIVFVQQRHTALFLTDIIQKDVALQNANVRICPAKLTGHGKTQDDQGMGHREQECVISDFRSGTYNLLVATSVAEEGLDIGACNLVIRYDAMTTVTALIQSRGRARHPDSRFVVIYMEGAVEEQTLKQLQAQEANMACVVDEIMAGGATDFKARLECLKLERKFLQQDAESVLERYCVRVADEPPIYEPSNAGWGAVQSYRCNVKLPLGCDVSRSTKIQGEDQSKKEDAKQDAAYKACILLHNSDRLVKADIEGCQYFLQATSNNTPKLRAVQPQLVSGPWWCSIQIGSLKFDSRSGHTKKKEAENDVSEVALEHLLHQASPVNAIPKQAKVKLLEYLQKQKMDSAKFCYSQVPPVDGSEGEESIDAMSTATAAEVITSEFEPTSALSTDPKITDSAAGVLVAIPGPPWAAQQGMDSNVNDVSAATVCIYNALVEANISAEASLQYAEKMVQDGCDTVAILTDPGLVDEEQLGVWSFKPFHRKVLLKWIERTNA